MTRATRAVRRALRRCTLALFATGFAGELAAARAAAQAAPSAHATHEEVGRAIERGTDFLVRTQEIDGSWRYVQGEYAAGQTALSLYTLLKCGLSHEHHAIRRARAFLEHASDATTYGRAVLLLARVALDDPAERPRIAALAEELAASQDGGFAYPHGELDLSNSQYGALGLAAAARAGCSVPAKHWLRLAQTVLAWQHDDGGFAYNASAAPTGAMTAAGVSTLVLCEQGLQGASTPPQLRASLARSREQGLAWLERHFRVDANPAPASEKGREERWTYYQLYGLERLGSFLATDAIGTHDWYREGANFLVRAQGADGRWSTPYGEAEPNTCFALLFLRRATALPTTGSGDALAARGIVRDDPSLDVGLRTAGDSPLEIWIGSFGKNARALYAWPGEAEQGLRIARVAYTIDGERVASFEADPARASPERFLVRHRFTKAGWHVLRARVEVLAPPPSVAASPAPAAPPDPPSPLGPLGVENEPELIALESPPLAIEAGAVLEDWMLEYAADRGRNLLSGVKCAATASSQINDHWRADFAVDLLQSRGWLAAADDPQPTLRLELARPVRTSRIVLSHAREGGDAPGTWARARAVEVTLNKRPPQVFALERDERRKSTLDLGRTEKILRLELRLLDLEPGKDPRRAAGIQEVELQLPESPGSSGPSSPSSPSKSAGESKAPGAGPAGGG